MKKLKIGDTVVIRTDSEYYGTHKRNPDDSVHGTILKVSNCHHCYFVKWDNAEDNSYREMDLKLVEEEPVINESYELF